MQHRLLQTLERELVFVPGYVLIQFTRLSRQDVLREIERPADVGPRGRAHPQAAEREKPGAHVLQIVD